ncbi:thioredoxin family protein [Levilactobacillus hammesii]
MKRSSILLIVVLILVLGSGIFVYHRKTADPLTKINTVQLSRIVTNKKETLVYIGRPNCPACEVFNSRLVTQMKNNIFRPKVYYYNTNANRNDKRFTSTLKKLNITSVPDFLVIKNGKVVKTYTGLDEFRKVKSLLE